MSRAPVGSLPLWCASLVLGGVALGAGCQRSAPALQGLEAPTVSRVVTPTDVVAPPRALGEVVPASSGVALVREMGGALWVHLGDAPPLMPEARLTLTDLHLLQSPGDAAAVSIVSTPPVVLAVPDWLQSARAVRMLDATGGSCTGTIGEQRTIYAWQPVPHALALAAGRDPETQAPTQTPAWTEEDWISTTLEVAQGDVWAQLTTTEACEGVRWAVADNTPNVAIEALTETIEMTQDAWQREATVVAAWQQLPAYAELQTAYDVWREENPAEVPWPDEVLNPSVGAFGFVRLGARWVVAGGIGEGCGHFLGGSWALFERAATAEVVAVADNAVAFELPDHVLHIAGQPPIVAGADWVAWQTADGWQRQEARVTMLESGC